MPQILASYDPSGVKRLLQAADELSTPAKIERAVHEGIRAAGDKVRTKVRRALHQQVGTKRYGVIVANTRSYIPGRLQYAIDGSGKGLPITEFPVSAKGGDKARLRWSRRDHWKLQPRGASGRFGKLDDTGADKAGVVASPWRVTHAFKRSFVDDKGIFRARLPGQKRGKGRKLYGAALWKEIIKDQTLRTFEAEAPREMDEQVAKRLARLLP